MYEKVHVPRSINKVTTRAFEFRFPHLNVHSLGKYLLGKFMFGCRCRSCVLMVVIYNMSGLCNVSILTSFSIDEDIIKGSLPAQEYDGANETCLRSSGVEALPV